MQAAFLRAAREIAAHADSMQEWKAAAQGALCQRRVTSSVPHLRALSSAVDALLATHEEDSELRGIRGRVESLLFGARLARRYSRRDADGPAGSAECQ